MEFLQQMSQRKKKRYYRCKERGTELRNTLPVFSWALQNVKAKARNLDANSPFGLCKALADQEGRKDGRKTAHDVMGCYRCCLCLHVSGKTLAGDLARGSIILQLGSWEKPRLGWSAEEQEEPVCQVP